ncbi:enterochelin esterase-like enzyme [Mycobacteroides abscessus subsp. abscessus]|nr:enterochelin esterase-like enzyme [Mycobacteroides abscessus subsp. abscessus]
MMVGMRDLSRRSLLKLGAATGAGAALLGAGAFPAGADGAIAAGSFVSAARGGVRTEWRIARPPGVTGPIRPIIALHGKGQTAAGVMEGGVENMLAQAVAAGAKPFALASVDGGGGYWHKRASGEDSGAMVLNEFIPLLAEQGLDTSRVAFLGWSMGGYGAMLLGSRLGAGRTAAITAVSPALWTSSGAAAPGAFDGARLFPPPAVESAPNGVSPGHPGSPARSGPSSHCTVRAKPPPASWRAA